MHRKILFTFCAVLAPAFGARADNPVSVPNTFVAGTAAKAADVNANFAALVNGINSMVMPLVVVDSAGHVVGPYMTSLAPATPVEGVFIRTSAASFFVQFGSSGAVSGGALAYTTSDCTGTAYIDWGSPVHTTLLTYAIVLNTTAYVFHWSELKSVSMASVAQLNGNSLQCTPTTYTATSAAPVVTTVDLSTLGFVPPFSVR